MRLILPLYPCTTGRTGYGCAVKWPQVGPIYRGNLSYTRRGDARVGQIFKKGEAPPPASLGPAVCVFFGTVDACGPGSEQEVGQDSGMRLAYLKRVGTVLATNRQLAQTLQPGSPTTQLAAAMPVAST